MATFRVISESNVRQLGVVGRPGPSFRALLFKRGGGAVSELSGRCSC